MSQQLRHLKGRIRSIEGTWKVTRAMEMVSMSKFKAFESPLRMGRAYFERVRMFFESVASVETSGNSPFMTKREGPAGLVVLSGDTGLCGIYNEHLMRSAEAFVRKQEGRPVKIYVYGRKGASYLRKRGIQVERVFPGFHGKLSGNFHETFLNVILEDFLQKKIADVHVAYTLFHNAMKHEPVVEKFLNVDKPVGKGTNFILEFGREGILTELMPLYLSSRFRLMMLESFTSEQSARMVAMKSAKDNAKELMGDLILLRNKVRQAAITKEVIEIISSVEALKG